MTSPAKPKKVLKPSMRPESKLARLYGAPIAGVDEAGRGPLAGPVVAAAVAFLGKAPKGINDSKLLSAQARESLYAEIMQVAAVGVGVVGVEMIDAVNIYHATHAAMCAAIANLPAPPAAVLIDGNRCPKDIAVPAEPLVGGDGLSLSVAAASIVAKVTRDRIMCELAAAFPVYGFEHHKGYATPEHVAALAAHGPCPHHRRSFRLFELGAEAPLLEAEEHN